MNLITTKNLEVSLDGHAILHDIEFRLAAGEMVGLIGPNGAGKSTFVKSLMKLVPLQNGSIFVGEQSLSKIGEQELARSVGYLPQGQEVHWPLSVERVVALGRIPHLMPWQGVGPADEAAVKEALVSTDTLALCERTVNHLAGGEKTLVMLARVLAAQPKVILADEPVAGLDPHHEIQVMQLLRDLALEGRGVLVVLHNLTLAARFCHRLYLMHEGRMLASGTPREVLSEQNLRQSYKIEAKFGEVNDEFYLVPWKRMD